jgi:hypothetical protein
MSKRTTIALAGFALAAIVGGAVATGWFEDEAAGSGMPVPGIEVDDTVVGGSEMPVPGNEDADEQIVGDSAGMPVPGFEGTVEETVVEGVSSGMVVPGYEGVVSDTVVHQGD